MRFPHRSALLFALAATTAAWLVAGLFAREPWKADEAYSFGLVLSMVRHGDWLVPMLGGEPFLEKPPLVFWLAAVIGSLAEPWLPLHVGARGANLILMGLMFGLQWLAGRRLYGQSRAIEPVLLLAASPALMISSRYLTADLGLLPAAAAVCLGLVQLRHGSPQAGWLLGAGMAGGLLSKGLLLPGATVLAVGLAALLCPAYRQRQALRACVTAVLVFLLLGGIWPLQLWEHAPQMLRVWLWDNNIERFFGGNDLGPANSGWGIVGACAAVLLPAWPLALLRTARGWPAIIDSPALGPLLLGLVWIAAILSSSTARAGYLLPVVVPLSLVAAGALRPLPVASRWPRRLAWGIAGLLAVTVVMVKLTLMLRDPTNPWASSQVQPALLGLAAAVATGWTICWVGGYRPRALLAANIGLVFAFTLALALFLPAADARSGFRGIFHALGQAMPASSGCVASYALGEGERGLLEYYTGMRTRVIDADAPSAGDCPVLIEQVRPVDDRSFGCPGSRVVWEGRQHPPGGDIFRICQRIAPP